MFTGIITSLGKITKIEKHKENFDLYIQPKNKRRAMTPGASVAINGVCLTINKTRANIFQATVIPETADKTNLAKLRAGDLVNLEQPLRAGDELGGHLVQGHVDGTAKVWQLKRGKDGMILKIRPPKNLNKFIAKKGSLCLNGVSLTVADKQKGLVSIALIPYTLKNTNLANLQRNDLINIEIDIIARYLYQLINNK